MIYQLSRISIKSSFRCYATTVTKRKPRSNAEKIRQSKEVFSEQTYAEKMDILNKFPNKLLRKKLKTPETFYLVNHKTASIIADYIAKDLPKNLPIIEVNPGPGLLTKKLLANDNISKLLLYENTYEFMPHLNELHSMYPERVKVKSGDFVNIWKLLYRDKQDNGTRFHDFLIDLPKSDYTNDINSRIYLGIGSLIFFKHLLNSLIFQMGLLTMGRPEFYVLIPPSLYIHLTTTNKIGYLIYRSTSILFQVMFEHKFLTKFPRENCLPWQQQYDINKTSKLAKLSSIDPEFLYLVKIVPRRNLYDLIAQEDMTAFWFFVKQNCISRKNRVIPNLEKWVPRCGLRLIVNLKPVVSCTNLHPDEDATKLPKYSSQCTTMSNQDHFGALNIFTEFGDLTPSQMLTLFHEFKSWPEYAHSPFLASLENSLLKMEQASEDNLDAMIINENYESSETEIEDINAINDEPKTNT